MSVQNKLAKLKNMSPDITAFAKTVAVIHSELPHYLPSYQKLLPQSIRIRVFPATPQLEDNIAETESETSYQTDAHIPSAEETESQFTQLENNSETKQKPRRKPGAPLQVSNHSKAINRETKDFTTVMLETNTSVQTYYNTVAGESATTPFSEVTPGIKPITDTTESSKIKSTPPVEESTGWKISSYLPGRASQQKASVEEAMVPVKKRELIAIRSIERRTRELVVSLRSATTNASKLMRLEEFSNHISKYPNSRNQAVRSKVMPCLMRLSSHGDKATHQQAMVALSLLGYTNPPKGRGVRILSIDGGGTRGLVAIELMKHLERVCQRPIHELFDYICGVSTGSLISIMIGAFRVPLDEVEQIYCEFSKEMFERSRLMGASKLFMSHAYYDTQLWEAILKQNFSETSFIDCMKDPLCPKLASVSALTNVEKIQCHVFRNYNLPPSVQSHYLGSCSFKLWEAIRASSAAPGYYEEFKLGSMVHQDGGVLTNNPAAIAIHECRLLWPRETLQCVVSLGTGRYEPTSMPQTPAYTSLKTKVVKIVQSATDTEAVHTVLHDLLQPSTYFRFNPYLSEDFHLDEVRADKWEQMLSDTQMYCRKNAAKLDDVATQLHLPRHIYQKISDKAVEKCSMMG